MSRDLHMPLMIAEIAIPDGRREIDPAMVKRLASSIDNIGLKHPITVRRRGDKYTLVAGLHRIEAHKKLGLDHIPACIVSMTNAEARMWEIAENLHRAELTKLERSEQISEWVELVSDNLTETKREGRPGAMAAASRELGIGEKEVERSIKIDGITDEAKQAAQDAGIDDNQSKLLEVAREAPERQVAKVRELVLPKTDHDVIEQQFTALMSAWNRAGPEARQKFRDSIDEPLMNARYGS